MGHQNGLEQHVTLVRTTSEDANLIYDIDILHIDGNHSEKSSLFDVMKWAPLVNEEGIIVFDDITWGTTVPAVDWLHENCIKILQQAMASPWYMPKRF